VIHARALQEFDVEHDDRDMRWIRVTVDDGTIPAPITVLLTDSGWYRLTNETDDPIDWIQGELRRQVEDVPDVDQVAYLRGRSPIELVVPEELR
jgi:hypothetical protein